MDTSDLKSFQYLENGEVQFSNLETTKVSNILNPGLYSLNIIEKPFEIPKTQLRIIDNFENSKECYHKNKNTIDSLFDKFFNKEIKNNINDMGFNHKVGILFHGKEGSGKSTIINNYCNKFIKSENAIVFNLDGNPSALHLMWDFISKIRKIQQNPIIAVFDEFDRFKEKESELKTILDGHLSLDNCLVFASTNYIDSIPNALKDRPSRFKYCFSFDGITSKEFVLETLTKMIGKYVSTHDISEYTNQLKDSTIDTIKQFCLDKVMNLEVTKTERRSPIGFNRN